MRHMTYKILNGESVPMTPAVLFVDILTFLLWFFDYLFLSDLLRGRSVDYSSIAYFIIGTGLSFTLAYLGNRIFSNQIGLLSYWHYLYALLHICGWAALYIHSLVAPFDLILLVLLLTWLIPSMVNFGIAAYLSIRWGGSVGSPPLDNTATALRIILYLAIVISPLADLLIRYRTNPVLAVAFPLAQMGGSALVIDWRVPIGNLLIFIGIFFAVWQILVLKVGFDLIVFIQKGSKEEAQFSTALPWQLKLWVILLIVAGLIGIGIYLLYLSQGSVLRENIF